ncbi:hypothetical protein R6Z07F_018550 [Ovis aries]
MAAKMEITLSSQSHIQASSKQERHIIAKLEEKREPALQKDWPDPELSRQSFRRFCYQEASGPQEALSHLRHLCRQWLQPEVHTKEQILELLVLEQFLNILPAEIQARARHRCPVSSKEIVTLVEDFHRAAKGPKQWVAVCMEGQKVLLEKTGSQLGEQELPDFQPQTPRRYPREETSQAGSQDQRSPPHWEKSLLLQEPTSRLAETETPRTKSDNKENPQQEGAKGAKPCVLSVGRPKGSGLQSPEPRGASLSEPRLSQRQLEAPSDAADGKAPAPNQTRGPLARKWTAASLSAQPKNPSPPGTNRTAPPASTPAGFEPLGSARPVQPLSRLSEPREPLADAPPRDGGVGVARCRPTWTPLANGLPLVPPARHGRRKCLGPLPPSRLRPLPVT